MKQHSTTNLRTTDQPMGSGQAHPTPGLNYLACKALSVLGKRVAQTRHLRLFHPCGVEPDRVMAGSGPIMYDIMLLSFRVITRAFSAMCPARLGHVVSAPLLLSRPHLLALIGLVVVYFPGIGVARATSPTLVYGPEGFELGSVENRVWEVGTNINEIGMDEGMTLAAQAVSNCVEPPSGLAAWWPGDSFINEVQGGLESVTWTGLDYAPAVVGSGFRFDGVDDYYFVADNGALHFDEGFAVSFWLYAESLSNNWQTIVWKGALPLDSGTANDNREYVVSVSGSGSVLLKLTAADMVGVGADSLETAAGMVTAGEWYHVGAVVDSVAQSKRIYLNGNLAAEGPFSASGIRSTSDGVFVGSSAGTSAFYHGIIDELMLFSSNCSGGFGPSGQEWTAI